MQSIHEKINELEDLIKVHSLSPSSSFWDDVKSATGLVLADAMRGGAELEANRVWFLHKVAELSLIFIECFEKMKAKKYYEAWCELERVKIGLKCLSRNAFYGLAEFSVPALTTLVNNWQRLFPYRVFFSPAYIIKERKCS